MLRWEYFRLDDGKDTVVYTVGVNFARNVFFPDLEASGSDMLIDDSCEKSTD